MIGLSTAFSYLVHPAKGEEKQPVVNGTKISPSSRLFEMLNRIFEHADEECDIEIAFIPEGEDGEQHNARRAQLLDFVSHPNLTKGRVFAKELQAVTKKVSGLGLLFLLHGTGGGRHKIVISRFPADEGILAEESGKGLRVTLIERVFMRNAKAYKAVHFEDASKVSGFWKGTAVDKQVRSSDQLLRKYWIEDFLRSRFFTKGLAGTLRIAAAFRNAINKSKSLAVKEELLAASRLVRNLSGRSTTAKEITERYGISEEGCEALREEIKTDRLFEDRFEVEGGAFEKSLAFEVVELNNGAILSSQADRFNKVFDQSPLDGDGRYRFTTEGTILNKRVRKTKI